MSEAGVGFPVAPFLQLKYSYVISYKSNISYSFSFWPVYVMYSSFIRLSDQKYF